jgi:NAD(P)-dependent dehydrogenase (short-subunit alcohol dehydrogenase family)
MTSINPQGVLQGRVALVTGASRGIGEAIARRFAMEGARVVVSARSVEEADHILPGTITETVERIKAAGGEALAVRADLTEAQDRSDLIEAAAHAYGPIDILVNNAAVTYYIPLAEFPEKRFRLMMDLQVWTPIELTQMVLPGMCKGGGGWILNISSHSAIHPAKTQQGRGGTVYGMCKAALERFSTGLAQEVFDENIGVNVISPGLVATPGALHHNLINDSNRSIVTPVEHMAEACLRLVHGDPQEITGRIDYADKVIEEFNLEPADLI